ncbi:hypothetical protein APHAL10511_005395 [Amanita phalloides]|nr:hypothetical protein APHAL10511_005395 [Amanita phalloides]
MVYKHNEYDATSLQKQRFSDLPIELKEYIVIKYMKDPDTTCDSLKALRLVCRQLNEIIAPRILSCLGLFRRGSNTLSNLLQLETLLAPNLNDCMSAVETLAIHEWKWIYGTNPFVSYRDLPIPSLLVPINTLVILYCAIKCLIVPQTIPHVAYKTILRLFARLRLSSPFKPGFNLPNIRRVIWRIDKSDPKWIISSTIKLLQQLPQLNELILRINEDFREMGSFTHHVSKLHNLRKLGIKFHYLRRKVNVDRDLGINRIGRIMAANPNLTHFDLAQGDNGQNIDLSSIFGHVPADRPLKLEHIGMYGSFEHPVAIVPHIRSLSSFHFADSEYTNVLLAEEIFPPVMSFGYVDEHTVEYLKRHPQITSLSFPDGGLEQEIFEIMARHSETLTQFSCYASTVYWSCNHPNYQTQLLRCTNLKRLVLHDPPLFPSDPCDKPETVRSDVMAALMRRVLS